MSSSPMNRKEFLTAVGKCCACGCVGAITGAFGAAQAQDTANPPDTTAPATEKPRSQARIEFAEKWAVRFFGVLDAALDEATRRKIMMANGKACFSGWIDETGRQIKPVTLDQMKKWIDENVKDGSISHEGNVIFYQYNSAAETGQPSVDNQCLCPLVETKPVGLSPTYCHCSVGYVKEWHDRLFGHPVEVELLTSVLRGDPRCKFKITV